MHDEKLIDNYAKTSDLQRHFEQITGENLNYLFDNWIYGKGYPVYSIYHTFYEDNIVNINIEQEQTDNSVDFFKLKLPFKIYGNNIDTIIYLYNEYDNQEYNLSLNFKPKRIEFDPENDIITRNSKVYYVKEPGFSRQIKIGPNPVSDTLTIELAEKIKLDNLTIYSGSGSIVKEIKEKYKKQIIEIDINELPPGIYIINFVSGNESASKKFIKN